MPVFFICIFFYFQPVYNVMFVYINPLNSFFVPNTSFLTFLLENGPN